MDEQKIFQEMRATLESAGKCCALGKRDMAAAELRDCAKYMLEELNPAEPEPDKKEDDDLDETQTE